MRKRAPRVPRVTPDKRTKTSREYFSPFVQRATRFDSFRPSVLTSTHFPSARSFFQFFLPTVYPIKHDGVGKRIHMREGGKNTKRQEAVHSLALLGLRVAPLDPTARFTARKPSTVASHQRDISPATSFPREILRANVTSAKERAGSARRGCFDESLRIQTHQNKTTPSVGKLGRA